MSTNSCCVGSYRYSEGGSGDNVTAKPRVNDVHFTVHDKMILAGLHCCRLCCASVYSEHAAW